MKVRALITLVIGNTKRHAGEVFDADAASATAWIKAGFVEVVRDVAPELAVRSDAERAVSRKGR